MSVMDETCVTETIAGEAFVIRRLSMSLALQIYGPAALAMSATPEDAEKFTSTLTPEEEDELEEKFFRKVMVTPRLATAADVRDPSTGRFPPGVYSLDDLGDYKFTIVRASTGKREQAQGFTEPSPVLKGSP